MYLVLFTIIGYNPQENNRLESKTMFVIEGSYSFNSVTVFIEYLHREAGRLSLGDVLNVRLGGFHLVMSSS